MTRNEALKILSRIWGGNPQHDLANSYADAFVALGMLKLDEPKIAEDRSYHHEIDAAIKKMGWEGGMAPVLRFCGLNIEQVLRHAGLKIVEK